MDKTALKKFSIMARNALIRSVADRCGLIGIREDGIQNPLPNSTKDIQFFDAGTGAPSSISGNEIEKRNALVRAIREKERDSDYKTAYQYIVEQVAYTWFNRLIAIRFMEVNEYLPSRIRVLSSEQEGKLEPDIISTPFDAGFDFTEQERDTIIQLKDRGQKEDMDALFRMLFVRQCDALHENLPELFQKVDGSDYTELLLNISFTDREGVVYHLVNDIPEDNFNVSKEGQVEIIGWMYQYYNTEPKDEVFALLKKNVKITKERIPAATQLFTPDWIVRYMIENSLGRLWVEHNCANSRGDDDEVPGDLNEALISNWKYYLAEAPQEPEVETQLKEIRKSYKDLTPEDIKVVDPCMGSGHILVYAFDVLMQIYEAQGYTQRDAARLIVEKNLFGLDIDKRAYQLAYFAVMMKARQYNRRILNGEVKPNLYAIEESNGINRSHLKYLGAGMSELERNSARTQLESVLDSLTNAKEYGSILNVEPVDWALLERYVGASGADAQMNLDTVGLEKTQAQLNRLLKQAQAMAQKYNVVCTNPPYMGSSGMSAKLSDYVKTNFPDSKSDLFAVFIERCGQMTKKNCYQAMITQHAWMFLASYEQLRKKLQLKSIINMAHLGPRAFDEIGGEVVQTTSFIMANSVNESYKGVYLKLLDATSESKKSELFLSGNERYVRTQAQFSEIEGIPYTAYWASQIVFDAFLHSKKVGDISEPRVGMATANNDRFVRLWYEVDRNKLGIGYESREQAQASGRKWFPFAKGGEQRKWYGNNDCVVNWENDGAEIQNFRDEKTGRVRSHNYNLDYIFQSALTWTVIGTDKTSFRFCPVGFLYSNSGYGMFCADDVLKLYLLGFMNSHIASTLLRILSPSMGFESGYLRKLPVVTSNVEEVVDLVKQCISMAQSEWDAFEASWDFKHHPLTPAAESCDKRISTMFATWEKASNDRFNQIKANEEELNRIFIDIYGLQDELTQIVEDTDITVRKADLGRDIRSLISYAVGCMFGRYSLDLDGLTYAGGEWDASKYNTFLPDEDNCIPITDEEYFKDDIVGRLVEFVRTVYGSDTLEDNLDFIANALGNKGNTSREVIRNYFLNDFIKDHNKIYQKRPIYWMYDSGKQNGFKVLIYMHRYDENTTGRIRADYLFKMQRAYENELKRVQDVIDGSSNSREVAQAEKRKEKLTKQLKETRDYDQKLAHLALARIPIDLDDGVKVNYEKIQTAPDGKKFDILAKI